MVRELRVLHLIPSLGGGGAERQLTYLARHLVSRGVHVHVGLLRGGPNLGRLEDTGAEIHWLRSSGNYDPLLVPRTIALVRQVQPDLVQTWITQMDVVGGLAALATRTPWIISERSAAAGYPKDVRHFLRRHIGRFASAVVANSPGGLGFWRSSFAQRFVVQNAVPFQEIDAAPLHEPAATGGKRVVLFAGRLVHVKNLPTLIQALEAVVARDDVVALLCGEGPLEETVRRLIAATARPERIHLLGFATNLPGLMKRADVFVSVSLWEGHPNVVIEAIACRCPVVMSDIAAHRAILDATTARFVPVDAADAICSAIAETLDDPHGARLRSARAREAIAHLTVERMGDEYVRIYKQVMGALARGAGGRDAAVTSL